MSLMELIKSNFSDLCKRFDMDPEETWKKYIEEELLKKPELVNLLQLRHTTEDLWDEFQQGLPGTSLNAFCLYALIRYFDMQKVLETGVANGFYTAFVLSAVKENEGHLDSVELSTHEDIACYVPYKDYEGWNLVKGVNALDFLSSKVPHDYDLCIHDSLHTRDHMDKEFQLFKQFDQTKKNFFVFFDDQNSQDWWEFALNVNMHSIDGYKFKLAEGRYCEVKGHLGGFIKYTKK